MSDGLQFDKVEPGTPSQAAVCAGCKSLLTTEFYVAQDVKFCASCRSAIEAQIGTGPSAVQLALAAGAGTAAAATAGVAYAAFLTNVLSESIVALFSGMLVGFVVRRASGNTGGRACQFLAVLITYLAVVGAFIPEFRVGNMSVLRLLIAPVASGQIWTTVLTGFGLYEAWRINQAPKLVFHGPFPVGGKATHG